MGFKGMLVFMVHSLGPLTYLQGRNRDADVGNGYVSKGGERESETNGEVGLDLRTLSCVNR